MDAGTQAIARALDASIADVAAKEFHRISRGMSDQEIATATTHALDSLGRLQTGQRIPNYGEWDALFYLTWYQPRQINLAYTVARRIPKDQNPLLEGRGNLQVVDFGCGALAMQFGLALMAADTLENRGSYPRMAIVSTDSRDEMPRIGRQMWCRFVEEIDDARKYPELDALRHVSPAIDFVDQTNLDATRWLTALHVAYKGNSVPVARSLNYRVANQKPDIIVVSSHPKAEQWVYRVGHDLPYVEALKGYLTTLDLANASFEATKSFRLGPPTNKINAIDSLRQPDVSRHLGYLRSVVEFNPPRRNFYVVYRRTDAD